RQRRLFARAAVEPRHPLPFGQQARIHAGQLAPDVVDNDASAAGVYTLSLHDALPICSAGPTATSPRPRSGASATSGIGRVTTILDRKSTRLNSSHLVISYAVFCLKKKKSKLWSSSTINTISTLRSLISTSRVLIIMSN